LKTLLGARALPRVPRIHTHMHAAPSLPPAGLAKGSLAPMIREMVQRSGGLQPTGRVVHVLEHHHKAS
jgi:hypothetical protein